MTLGGTESRALTIPEAFDRLYPADFVARILVLVDFSRHEGDSWLFPGHLFGVVFSALV